MIYDELFKTQTNEIIKTVVENMFKLSPPNTPQQIQAMAAVVRYNNLDDTTKIIPLDLFGARTPAPPAVATGAANPGIIADPTELLAFVSMHHGSQYAKNHCHGRHHGQGRAQGQ